jgi:glycerol-1-phosphatase
VTLDATHACVVDLDGVVWLAGEPLPGAREGIALLRGRDVPVLFATNNASPTVAELRARLGAMGVDADAHDVATSAQSAAALVGQGARAFVVGSQGLVEALELAGVLPATSDDADTVVVGLTTSFDYALIDVAAALVRGGARFVATNVDPTLPAPGGLRPGAGALVAAVATAAGREPEVAGKPTEAMARLVRSRVTPGAVVGDRASTDGAFAARLGVPFAHVASDVDEEAPSGASVRARTLVDAVEALLSMDG